LAAMFANLPSGTSVAVIRAPAPISWARPPPETWGQRHGVHTILGHR
jgi:hypothetical protein